MPDINITRTETATARDTENQSIGYRCIITGTNTFTSITLETPDATYKYSSLVLPAGVTTLTGASGFVAAGTSSYQISITSSLAGTPATMSNASGTNAPTYLSIKDSTVTGGATWDGTGAGTVNVSGNTGWNWAAAADISLTDVETGTMWESPSVSTALTVEMIG